MLISVDKQPAINKMDSRIPNDSKAALIFGCLSPVGIRFGNDTTSSAAADRI